MSIREQVTRAMNEFALSADELSARMRFHAAGRTALRHELTWFARVLAVVGAIIQISTEDDGHRPPESALERTVPVNRTEDGRVYLAIEPLGQARASVEMSPKEGLLLALAIALASIDPEPLNTNGDRG